MSFFDFLEMIISELVPAGLIITVIPSFIVFCLMKICRKCSKALRTGCKGSTVLKAG